MTFRSSYLTIVYALPIAVLIISSGCSALQEKRNSLLIPPNTLGNEQLICSSEDMKLCSGFLTQKDIIKEK